MENTQLNAMTVKDLRECAKRLGIKRISTLKQRELVEAIEALGSAAIAVVGEVRAEKEKTQVKASSETKRAVKTSSSESSKAKRTAKSDSKEAADSAKASQSTVCEEATAEADKDSKGGKASKKVQRSTAKLTEKDALGDEEDGVESGDALENAKAKKDASAVEEPIREPDSIFIDRGAILPEFVPGTCLYALVRDPGTLFVYWNASFESPNGWLLTAYDAFGNVLQSFETPVRRNGRGYFRVPTARVARVTLSAIASNGQLEVRLESRIRIAQQLGIAQPALGSGERWVDVNARKVVYEAPAEGRAPGYDMAVERAQVQTQWTGGGYDRSYDASTEAEKPTSSRFGRLSDTPSSDTFLGSSDRLIRK